MWYYLSAISAFAVVLCVYDKWAAIARKSRVRESFLHLISLMGGALAMWITMLIVRHKTKHISFMIPLPIMVICHVVLFIIYGKNYGYWI